MTTTEMMNQLPGVLLYDDRILSARERELLVEILRRTGSASNGDAAARDKIARAIGETIAQRAFTLLGASIAQSLLDNPAATDASVVTRIPIYGRQPQPPAPGPPGTGTPPPAPSPSPS